MCGPFFSQETGVEQNPFDVHRSPRCPQVSQGQVSSATEPPHQSTRHLDHFDMSGPEAAIVASHDMTQWLLGFELPKS